MLFSCSGAEQLHSSACSGGFDDWGWEIGALTEALGDGYCERIDRRGADDTDGSGFFRMCGGDVRKHSERSNQRKKRAKTIGYKQSHEIFLY